MTVVGSLVNRSSSAIVCSSSAGSIKPRHQRFPYVHEGAQAQMLLFLIGVHRLHETDVHGCKPARQQMMQFRADVRICVPAAHHLLVKLHVSLKGGIRRIREAAGEVDILDDQNTAGAAGPAVTSPAPSDNRADESAGSARRCGRTRPAHPTRTRWTRETPRGQVLTCGFLPCRGEFDGIEIHAYHAASRADRRARPRVTSPPPQPMSRHVMPACIPTRFSSRNVVGHRVRLSNSRRRLPSSPPRMT